jgi:predicted NUDIX family NTP pyrophosphohydrolase
MIAALGTTSAGLLLYRHHDGRLEALLVHPGGPFWRRRNEGAWSIPKGECAPGDTNLSVALREFEEELGMPAPRSSITPLGSVRQAGGKVVHAWMARGEFDVSLLRSNTFDLEWPPGSGRMKQFPEVDRAGWFEIDEARRMILPAQSAFLDRLTALLADAPEAEA